MRTKFVAKVRLHISIAASKKSANILDGAYKSILKGRSMDFHDLRAYVPGDDVKDIDWKSTAKSGSLLVRRYITEKKHNLMFVLDSGLKMNADTEAGMEKRDVAMMGAGVLAYLAQKNGDVVGAVYNKGDAVQFFPFKSGLSHLELILQSYYNQIYADTPRNLNNLLEFILKNVNRKMMMLVVTDLAGLETLREDILRKFAVLSDVMFLVISDAYLTDTNAFDLSEQSYIAPQLTNNKKLRSMEQNMRKSAYAYFTERFKKHRITMIPIHDTNEITQKIIELLERHRDAISG